MDTQGMVNRCASDPTSSSQVSAVVVGTLFEGTLYVHYRWKGPLQFIYPGVLPLSSAVPILCCSLPRQVLQEQAAMFPNVSPLLLTLQGCTDGGKQVPELLGLC